MMKRILFISGFALLLILAACGDKFESNMSRDIPDIAYTDQNGETVELDDLKGKWWVADLIFTNCETVCIPMTLNMLKIQEQAAEKGLDVNFLSFSVDPEYDSPEVLREYADEYSVDLDNWTFLTGYEFETIQEIAEETFLTGVQKEANSDQVNHGTRFYLINPEGKVIKHYSGLELDALEKIIEDLDNVL